MALSPPGAPAPSGRRRRPLSKKAKIGLGLLFTLVGLFLLADALPSAPGPLGRILPVAAAGLLALWLGGILMGIGSRS
ncbi:MAG TPA: hypothetical protein VML94_04135 [Thermoplasmata archaeon]|nr:hypothetical protein [Thermoplasmata archaeon]